MSLEKRVIAIIPARMGSTRFPGKPLVKLLGLAMVEHVRQRTASCSLIDEVIVATCDEEIMGVVREHGGKAVMTSAAHERCTDRVAEAARDIECDIVVNVQGDEPLISPEVLEQVVTPLLRDRALQCVNLITEIDHDEFVSADIVKTVFDLRGNALYFSREAIPSKKKAGVVDFPKYKQLGVIAFRSEFLQLFAGLIPTPLEVLESVDMMRAVEHGHAVRTVCVDFDGLGVDTPGDMARVCQLLEASDLTWTYLSSR